VWAFADGQGEGTFGRILALSETDDATTFYHQNAANTLVFYQVWSGTDGQWTFPATDGQWNAVALSYDGSLTTNNPVARVNFAPVTVTQVASDPSGTFTAPATGYCIGNNTGGTRTWDGALQHLQFFNVILTADEMDAALRYPGSIRRGLVSHWPMLHAGYTVDLVNTASRPTATALANRDGAPCRMMWPSKTRGWRGAFAPAPPAFQPAWAMGSNVLVGAGSAP